MFVQQGLMDGGDGEQASGCGAREQRLIDRSPGQARPRRGSGVVRARRTGASSEPGEEMEGQ